MKGIVEIIIKSRHV